MSTLAKILLAFVALSAPLAALIAWILLPIWATPIAMWWYKPGFEEAVTDALSRLPKPASYCIYDDQMGLFVTDPSQLAVDRMIAGAVRDRTPDYWGERQRDPHFRVYSDGATYYWSFDQSALIRFQGDRWTLRGVGHGRCENYNAFPEDLRQVYRDRVGLSVTEANFCCDTGQPID